MRVIAGSAKGTTLKTPEGMRTRPTTDRVKEALFSNLSCLELLCWTCSAERGSWVLKP